MRTTAIVHNSGDFICQKKRSIQALKTRKGKFDETVENKEKDPPPPILNDKSKEELDHFPNVNLKRGSSLSSIKNRHRFRRGTHSPFAEKTPSSASKVHWSDDEFNDYEKKENDSKQIDSHTFVQIKNEKPTQRLTNVDSKNNLTSEKLGLDANKALKPEKRGNKDVKQYQNKKGKYMNMKIVKGKNGKDNKLKSSKSPTPVCSSSEVKIHKITKNKSIAVIPPPDGYFAREDFSNSESLREQENMWNSTKNSENVSSPNMMAIKITLLSPPSLLAEQSPEHRKKELNEEQGEESKKPEHCNTVGIIKHSDNDKAYPLLYTQKKINPKNCEYMKVIENLPVSMDSVLYYYELNDTPSSKTQTLKVPEKETQFSNSAKYNKTNHNHNEYYVDSLNSPAQFKEIIDHPMNENEKDIANLNVNLNANTSDTDIATMKDKIKLSGVGYLNDDVANSPVIGNLKIEQQGESVSELIGKQGTNILENPSFPGKGYSLKEESPYKVGNDQGVVLMSENNDESALDTVVDDFIEQAVKAEVEDKQGHLQDRTKSKGNSQKRKSSKTEVLASKFDKPMLKLKKPGTKDEVERLKAKRSGKACAIRSDCSPKEKGTRIGSHSSPTISASIKLDGIPFERTSDRFLHSKASPTGKGVNDLDNSYMSDDEIDYGDEKNYSADQLSDETEEYPSHNSEQGEMTTILVPGREDEISYRPKRENTQDDESASEKEDNVSIKSKEKSNSSSPDRPKRSNLRKSNLSGNRARSESYRPAKPLKKRKSALVSRKSSSLSPVSSGKRKHRDSSGPTESPRRTDSRESRELSGKKSPGPKHGKKKTKKVRIMICNVGSPSMKMQVNDFKAEEEEKSPKKLASPDIFGSHINKDKDEGEDERFYDDDDEDEDEEMEDYEERDDNDSLIGKGDEICEAEQNISQIESTPSPVNVETKAKIGKKTKPKTKKKAKNKEENKSKPEQTPAKNSRTPKSNTTSKATPVETKKKKRYQLTKTKEQVSPKRKSPTRAPPVDLASREQEEQAPVSKRSNASTVKKEGLSKSKSPTANKIGKASTIKRPPSSPKINRKKPVEVQRSPLMKRSPIFKKPPVVKDPLEGSSVDAPGYGKKDPGLKLTKSGAAYSVGKTNSRDIVESNQAQRLKMVRDNFSKHKRNNVPSSLAINSPVMFRNSPMVDTQQVSPMISRSTDLDVASGLKRQFSPYKVRIPRRESKEKGSKKRSHSEHDENKEKPSPRRISPRRTQQFSDPIGTHFINVGLQWLVQGLISRLSFFNNINEEDEVDPQLPDLDTHEKQSVSAS